MTGIAADLSLDVNIPAVLEPFKGTWVKYGVLERAYALANPADWTYLVETYGHTAIAAMRYTASAFLGGILGRLWKNHVIAGFTGPATARWS